MDNTNSCGICYNTLVEDTEYAKINNPHETGRYHIHCLVAWLNNSRNGILSQDRITSYQIFINEGLISTVNLPTAPPLNGDPPPYEYIAPLPSYEHSIHVDHRVPITNTPWPNLIYHNEHELNNHDDQFAIRRRQNTCRLFSCAGIIIIILVVAFVSYFIIRPSHTV